MKGGSKWGRGGGPASRVGLGRWARAMAMAWVFVPLMGQSPASRKPTPAEGRVDAGGKFTPAFVQPDPKNATTLPRDLEAFAKSLVKVREDGTLSLGMVTVDPKARQVSIPAQVNQVEGTLEYALVTASGKVHESLLSTEASAVHVHMALLLLDLAPRKPEEPAPRLQMEVEWRGNGPVQRCALEEWVVLTRDTPSGRKGSRLAGKGWEYGGSRILEGRLAAEMEGSVIALIGDPMALAGYPRPEHPVDDMMYAPNRGRMPSLGMPVVLRLRPMKAPATNGAAAVRGP